MDLRTFNLSSAQIELASQLLDYQPFIITDDLQTGVAYSWMYSDDPRVKPPLVFWREQWDGQWDKITAANGRLRQMYDDFIDEIVSRFPRGSLFDVACNNGYFPVRAASRGMTNCTGSDLSSGYAKSIDFLNGVMGTKANFIHAPYDPQIGRGPTQKLFGRLNTGSTLPKFDVVVATAIMCHIPNPTNFLAYLGSVAKEAIFFWGQMLDTDEFVTAYNPPHPNLSDAQKFPYCFNDNTRVSKGLFREAARLMGFREVIFLPPRPHWLFVENPGAGDLTAELRKGSSHIAALALR